MYSCVVLQTVCSHTICIASLHSLQSRLALQKIFYTPQKYSHSRRCGILCCGSNKHACCILLISQFTRPEKHQVQKTLLLGGVVSFATAAINTPVAFCWSLSVLYIFSKLSSFVRLRLPRYGHLTKCSFQFGIYSKSNRRFLSYRPPLQYVLISLSFWSVIHNKK